MSHDGSTTDPIIQHPESASTKTTDRQLRSHPETPLAKHRGRRNFTDKGKDEPSEDED